MTGYLIESWDEMSIRNKTYSLTSKELIDALIETIEDLDLGINCTPDDIINDCIKNKNKFYMSSDTFKFAYSQVLVLKMWYLI
jgi:hypothetical protein